jgi:hypothetical protein
MKPNLKPETQGEKVVVGAMLLLVFFWLIFLA